MRTDSTLASIAGTGVVPFLHGSSLYEADGTPLAIDGGDIFEGTMTLTQGISGESKLDIGTACINSLTFTLNNWEGKFDNFDFVGSYIVLNLAYTVSNSPYQFAMGKFYIASHRSAGHAIQVVAYDGLVALDSAKAGDLNLTYTATASQIITAIAAANNLTINGSIPASTTNFPSAPNPNITQRQLLQYACQAIGAYAWIDEDGELNITQYGAAQSGNPTLTVFSSQSVSTDSITISGINIIPYGSDTVYEYRPGSYSEEYLIQIAGNELIVGANESLIEPNLAGVVGKTMTPCNINALFDARIQPGDTVTVTDANSNTFTTFITNIIYKVGNLSATYICSAETAESNDLRMTQADSATVSAAVAQAEIAEQREYFWHDNSGAHVLGDATGYRTDVKSTGMEVVKVSTSDVVAKFGADGYTVGRTDESYQMGDYHSWQMIDKNGTIYAQVQDMRDASGIATISETFEGTGFSYFPLQFSADSVVSVTVDGVATTEYTLTGQGLILSFNTPPAEGSLIEVTYESTSGMAKAYTFGLRNSGSFVGALSFAEGYYVTASGVASHVEGYDNLANAMYSHTEGASCTADGMYSHVEGYQSVSTANAKFSHVEGSGCEVNARASHAEGAESVANGDASHAQNLGTIASSDYQTALGKYNVEDSSDTYALMVGNGSSDTSRSNAMTLDWNGNGTLAGKLTLGSAPSANMDVATKKYVDDSITGMATFQHYYFGSSTSSHTFNIGQAGPVLVTVTYRLNSATYDYIGMVSLGGTQGHVFNIASGGTAPTVTYNVSAKTITVTPSRTYADCSLIILA